jgi:hypothetical protein
MKELIVALMMLAAIAAAPDTVTAQMPCPQEVETAKQMLKSYLTAEPVKPPRSAAAARQGATAQRSEEIQAPREQQDIQAPRSRPAQAPRGQDEIQAPREQQDIQAPRSRPAQAPRGQDEIQAPREQQDIQAPRSKDVQAPRAVNGKEDVAPRSRALIRDAEAACKRGDMAAASEKANAAIEILKGSGGTSNR